MTSESKIRVARLIAIVVVILALRFVGGGKAWEYMVDHVWLALLLPVAALFVLIFWRSMDVRRRRGTGDGVKVNGAQNAKP